MSEKPSAGTKICKIGNYSDWENALHIWRKLGVKVHFLVGDRMHKFQLTGMESLPMDIPHIRMIQKIPNQRMADVLHMDADLVCSSGFKG